MSKLQNMRCIEIPAFRAVSSGEQTLNELFGEDSLFQKWVNEHGNLIRMPNPDGMIDKALEISQQQIFLPIQFLKG